MGKGFRGNLIFLLVAHVCWLAEPALIHAETASGQPANFTQPLNVARGAIMPIGQEAMYFDDAERCDAMVNEWGWDTKACAGVEQLLIGMGPDIDTLVVNVPVSEGYVELDDWTGDVSSEVDEITKSYKEAITLQSTKLGTKIEFVGWRLYPKVDKSRNIMYFANILNWGGENTLNITVTIFDRYGYVPMKIIPTNADLDSAGLQRVVDQAVSAYKPRVDTSYFAFESGDKVATYGALSVFAGLLGVKYAKTVGAGVFAIALLFLKKAWFIVLLPLVWIGRLFGKKKDMS